MWLSVDPMADKFPAWTPYHFVHGNPINLVDPDGRQAWQPDGDGGWIAEAGDGAETLAQDAGISREQAYSVMEQQGFGTYVDSDGVTKSGVDPGDRVQLSYSSPVVSQSPLSSGETPSPRYSFSAGQRSGIEVLNVDYVSGGHLGVSGGISKISMLNSSAGNREVISSGGFGWANGAGPLKMEIMAATRGQVTFDQAAQGNSLMEVFGNTSFVRIESYSALLKYSNIQGFNDAGERLWHSNSWGGGVSTGGFGVGISPVNWQPSNKPY